MHFQNLLCILIAHQVAVATTTSAKPATPSSAKGKVPKIDKCASAALTTEFSAGFKQPHPPVIQAEFTTSFVQHKWNQKMSSISTGFIHNLPSKGLILVDQVVDGMLTSSVFDYNNVTYDDNVDHTMTAFQNASKSPVVWRGYDAVSFPILTTQMLVNGDAVFIGQVTRDFSGRGVGWMIMDRGKNPLTIYLNPCNVAIGYDYFLRDEKTRVVTEFFNTNITAVAQPKLESIIHT
ncbi:unnamed protein product [Fusarium graminearum]|nr:unnamed protein product [Fusarium graminearum]